MYFLWNPVIGSDAMTKCHSLGYINLFATSIFATVGEILTVLIAYIVVQPLMVGIVAAK